jgi:hypothetical protein
MNTETKNCQNCKQNFTIDAADFEFYKKIQVPPPTWCPQCRMRRRMMFRNERRLFRVKEALSGKEMVGIYPPEAGFPIYDDKTWFGQEGWDPLAYGQEIDWNRPFLAQLQELNLKVPRYRQASINMVNSEYSGNADGLRNCYLVFNANYNEDCAYGNGVDTCKNCYDNSHIKKSERCYNSFWLNTCYDTHYSSQCDDCTSVWFSKNCRGCTNCFGCVNLRSKNYCFFNEQLTKEEYQKRLDALRLDTYAGIEAAGRQAREFWLKFPIKNLQGTMNTNVSGDFISNSKNVHHGYLIREAQDVRYVQYGQAMPVTDHMDVTVCGGSELVYEAATSGWHTTRLRFCWECWDGGQEFEYCMHCGGTAMNLFGCVSVRNKQYCILNRQYSKDEYFALRKKIVEHMNAMPYVDAQGRVYKYGEFFPPEFSPFTYNQTISPEHFNIAKGEAIAFGARWQDPNPTEYQTTIAAGQLPDAIADVQDDVLKQVIQCTECKRAYRIIAPELQFLRQVKIPLPRTCVDCRHNARISQRNRAVFYYRQCACDYNVYTNSAKHLHHQEGRCQNKFETSFAADRPEIVYCETCYNAEVS